MPLVYANPNRPRRVARSPFQAMVDLLVTPPGGMPGGINPGELVYLTAASGVASLNTPGASAINTASCVGVSNDAYPLQYAAGVYAANIFQNPSDGPVPTYVSVYDDGDHLFFVTAADAYAPYQPVYLGTNARTITNQASGNGTAIGFVSPDQRQAIIPDVAQRPLFYALGAPALAGTQIFISIRPALSR